MVRAAEAPFSTLGLLFRVLHFARELAHRIGVMDRGEIVIDDATDRLNPEVVKRHIAV